MGSACLCLYITSGSFLIIGGATLAGLFNQIFSSFLNTILIVDKENGMFDTFREPPIPIHLDFYFFNVTNPSDVLHYGEKPIVEEIGPYSYYENITRQDFRWYLPDKSVEYKEIRTYYFDPARSSGSEEDEIVTLNAIMVVAAAMGYQNRWMKELVWPEIEGSLNLFETFTVKQLLFDGFPLPTFDFNFSNVSDKFDWTENLTGTLYEILEELLGTAPEALKENRFGFYFERNGSLYGKFRVKSGKKGMEDYLHIQTFNDEHQLTYWNESFCNMINGTDGTQFPPRVNKGHILRIFNVDLCRSIYLEYERDAVLYNLLDGYRFIAPEEVLKAPPENPENACFCVPLPMEDGCLNDGMLNLAPCFKGAPIIISTPHFYQGDVSDQNKIIGLNPNKRDHETYVDVEPNTGLVLNASKRIQLNLPLKRYTDLPSFMNVPELIFPILWANENTELPMEEAEALHKMVTLPYIIAYSLLGLTIIVGIALLSFGVVQRKSKFCH